MMLKNGNKTIRFTARVHAPYDMHNVGEVAGFPAAEADKIIAAKTPTGDQAAIDFIPTSPAELAELPKLVRADLVDATEAKKVVNALVSNKALNGDAAKTLVADIDAADKARVAQASAPASQSDITGILQQLAELTSKIQQAPASAK